MTKKLKFEPLDRTSELNPGVYIISNPLPGNNRTGLIEYRIIQLKEGHGITQEDVYDKSYPNLDKVMKFENIPFSTDYASVCIKAGKLAKSGPISTLQFNRSYCAMRKFPARRDRGLDYARHTLADPPVATFEDTDPYDEDDEEV